MVEIISIVMKFVSMLWPLMMMMSRIMALPVNIVAIQDDVYLDKSPTHHLMQCRRQELALMSCDNGKVNSRRW